MKKILCLVLTATTLCVSMIGCGKKDGVPPKNDSIRDTEPISVNLEEMLEQGSSEEEIIEARNKEMFYGVDTLKGNSKETYLGTLKDTTNEFSAVLMDGDCENLAIITFKSDKIPNFKFLNEIDYHKTFFHEGFVNTETNKQFDKNTDEYYISGSKDFSVGISNPKVSVTTNTFTSDKTRSFDLSFYWSYLSMNDDLESPEEFKKSWGREVWQYKDFFISNKDEDSGDYEIYIRTPLEYDNLVLELSTNNSENSDISEDEIKQILDCITIEYTTSEEKNFNPNHCYLEDAVAKVLNEKYGLAVRDVFRLANLDNDELTYIFTALENEEYSADRCYCVIEPTEPRYIDSEKPVVGKYGDYLVLTDNNGEPDLVKLLDKLSYDDKFEYVGLSFEDANIGHRYAFSVDELKDYFLKK